MSQCSRLTKRSGYKTRCKKEAHIGGVCFNHHDMDHKRQIKLNEEIDRYMIARYGPRE